MMHSLFQIALLLVPAVWRASVERDLLDEAAHFEHGGWWRLREAFVTGVRLRWEFSTSAARTDIRHAMTSLMRTRTFALGVLCVLTGVCFVEIAVFASLDRVLFRRLPYTRPEELYVIVGQTQYSGYEAISTTLLAAIADRGLADGLSVNATRTIRHLPGLSDDEELSFLEVTPNALSVLGVRPSLGRDFAANDVSGAHAVVLLSDAAWRRVFHASPRVVGTIVNLGTQNVQIAGILPADFIVPHDNAELGNDGLWAVPMSQPRGGVDATLASTIVRVPGQHERAELQLNIGKLAEELKRAAPNAARPTQLVEIRTAMNKSHRSSLWSAIPAAAVIWLVGCAHVSRVFLLRLRHREKAVVVHLALGSGRTRIIRSAIIEVALVAIVATWAGLVAWSTLFRAVVTRVPPILGAFASAGWEPRLLVFAASLAVVTTAVIAAPCLWHAASITDVRPGRRATRTAGRWLSAASEAAIGVVVVAAGIAGVRSIALARGTKLGFAPEALQSVHLFYRNQEDTGELGRRIYAALQVIRAMPDVETAVLSNSGVVESVPAAINNSSEGVRVGVGGGYFDTAGMTMLAGRAITERDVASATPVAVISRGAAGLLLPHATIDQTIGQTVQAVRDVPRVVIGVVEDVAASALGPRRSTLYAPIAINDVVHASVVVVVRTRPGTQLGYWDLRARIAGAVAEAPERVVLRDHASRANAALKDHEFRAALFGLCAVIVSLLLGFGLYAVAAFNAQIGALEFAVRAALGAPRGVIERIVLLDTLRPLAVGIPLGVAIAWWCAPVLQPLLFRVVGRSFFLLALSSAVVLAAALAAVLRPARQAGQVAIVRVLNQQ